MPFHYIHLISVHGFCILWIAKSVHRVRPPFISGIVCWVLPSSPLMTPLVYNHIYDRNIFLLKLPIILCQLTPSKHFYYLNLLHYVLLKLEREFTCVLFFSNILLSYNYVNNKSRMNSIKYSVSLAFHIFDVDYNSFYFSVDVLRLKKKSTDINEK